MASKAVRDAYKLVVVGSGSGGCSMAAKFSNTHVRNSVALIDPAEFHYYQPMWTMVGGGLKTIDQSGAQMRSVIPRGVHWYNQKAVAFKPNENKVVLADGKEISYEYLIVAMGLQINWDKIPGLTESLKSQTVCSIYSPETAKNTYKTVQEFIEKLDQNSNQSNAVFTFPNTPVKCPGAGQKIMYLTDWRIRQKNKRDKAAFQFNTSLPVMFGCKKYAVALTEICKRRNITVNFRTNLTRIDPSTKNATFENLDTKETKIIKFDFMHVVPPMSSPDTLASSSLSDQAGFLDVDKFTLQHKKYPNIFGLGDCVNTPNGKTAAAVAAQSGVLYKNLTDVMKTNKPLAQYDGYASCPLLTGYGKVILAEFDYQNEALETFPIDQSKERRSMYIMKADVMPFIYWNLMLKGYWSGPGMFRRLMRLGFGN